MAGDSKSANDDDKKKGLALLAHDLKQKPLVPVKILFALIMASISVLLPYQTIHMKSLGISVQETAVIYGVVPIFSILSPSAMGFIGDKMGNFNVRTAFLFATPFANTLSSGWTCWNAQILLNLMLVACGANALVFLAVPTARRTHVHPSDVTAALGCSPASSSSALTLTDLDAAVCQPPPASASASLSFTVRYCGYVCYDAGDGRRDVAPGDDISPVSPFDAEPFGVTKLSRAHFLADRWRLNVTCPDEIDDRVCRLSRVLDNGDGINVTDVHLAANQSAGLDTLTVERLSYDGRPMRRLECGDGYDRPVSASTVALLTSWSRHNGLDVAGYASCRRQCVVRLPRALLCANPSHTTVYNTQLTFWSYLVLRITFAIVIGGSATLFEGACLAVIAQYNGDLGLQRLFGVLGMMIFSPVSGALIDYVSTGLEVPDFRPAFYMYAAMIWCAAIVISMVNLEFKPPTKELMKNLKIVLKNVELDMLFLVNFMAGTFFGHIESYLFWFLEDMGGSKSLMGLTLTVSAVSGIPALLLADVIFRKVGHPNVQFIGFLFYAFRLVGYSFIIEPSMCLIFEAMEAVTAALMTTSAIAYATQLSTSTTMTTVLGIINTTYYGLGKGTGSLIGGLLMKSFGVRPAFRVLAVAAAVAAAAYLSFNVFHLRPKAKRLRHAAGAVADAAVAGTDAAVAGTDAAPGLDNPVFVAEEPPTSTSQSPGVP